MDMTSVKKYARILFISLVLLTTFSCSTVPVLNINYRVPGKTDQLKGKKVFLEIRDSRADKDMLGEGAKEDFKNVIENVSLSVAEGDERGFKIGIFSVTDLMREIFKERLAGLGLEVVTDINSRGEEPTIAIDLQTFKLDLIKGTVKRTWTAKIAYIAEVQQKGKFDDFNGLDDDHDTRSPVPS